MIGLLMAPTRFPHSMVPLLQQGNLQESPLGRYRMALLIKNAVTCLDLYFLQNSRYPDTLEQVAATGLMHHNTLTRITATGTCDYQSHGTTYNLTCR